MSHVQTLITGEKKMQGRPKSDSESNENWFKKTSQKEEKELNE